VINSFIIDRDSLKASTKPIQGFIKASDGVNLAYAAYTLDKPKGCMVFLHGGGAHSLAGYTLWQALSHFYIFTGY
jgi:alpha-beta hydrolase superfamily lysophospholipase